MLLGVSLPRWPDIPCFGHTLQLCVGAGLNTIAVSKLIATARKLIGHFKHSSLAMSALMEKQKALNIPEHRLVHRLVVINRWNSSYSMLERLAEQRWAIYGVLHDETVSKPDHRKLDLKEEQWELISDLLVVIKPLQIATTALCEEQNVSLSSVYPVVNGLRLAVVPSDNSAVKAFKEVVSMKIKQHFHSD